MNKIKPYMKAILAAGIAFTGGLAVGYAEEPLTKAEFWLSVSSGLTAAGVVFRVPNKAVAPVEEEPW